MSDDTFFLFDLRGMRRKKVMSALDGGLILLDGGLVLLREGNAGST